jgi:hypothetical protein
MKGGATEFLLKPFDEDDLVRAIDAAIAFDRRERAEQGSLRDFKSRYQRMKFFLSVGCCTCSSPRKPINLSEKLASFREFHLRIWAGESTWRTTISRSSMAWFIGSSSYRICGKHDLKKR